MFYDHVFTHDERQALLLLAESFFLVKTECPDYLKKSKHSIEIRHTINHRGKERRSGHIVTSFVPRIHMSVIQRLVRVIRDDYDIRAAQHLSKLFELGLGVPKQRDIALYLSDYSKEADPKGVGMKYIRKLINEYHRKYRRSMAGSRWIMPAAYTANMMHMQSFIHLKENGYAKQLKVPDGIPVVLVYNNTNHERSEFTLCDAFMISPLGFPVPFAQIALRPEFKAVPKTFCSKALRGRGVYSMVMGVVHWSDTDSVKHFRELMDIDADSYLTLLDSEQYMDRRSPEYQALCDKRAEYNEQRVEMNEVLAKFGTTKRILKPEQQAKLDRAHKFFADRKDFFKEFEQFEKKEQHKAAKQFAVASAQFAAIDCGTIMDRTTYMAVSTTLDKVHHILGKWGFTTVDTVNASLKHSLMTYGESKATRRWSL